MLSQAVWETIFSTIGPARQNEAYWPNGNQKGRTPEWTPLLTGSIAGW